MQSTLKISEDELLSSAEIIRLKSMDKLDSNRQKENSQYFTPLAIAKLMVSMVSVNKRTIDILDPGAGSGILSSAAVSRIIKSELKPEHISITAIENDPYLIPYLSDTLGLCKEKCRENNIDCEIKIETRDFIEIGAEYIKSSSMQSQFFFDSVAPQKFDLIIMNPPYKKISSNSRTRKILSSVGIETSNLYSAFLAISTLLLNNNGQLIAITPRSFSNGPYFNSFRDLFFRSMRITHIHIFNSRTESFKENDVLQENVIFNAIKNTHNGQPLNNSSVTVTSSNGPKDEVHTQLTIPHNWVVNPNDPNRIIHIISDKNSEAVMKRISKLSSSLDDLGIKVSTGKVVDFRVKELLSSNNNPNSVPLIYPAHFKEGVIDWPNRKFKKPDAIINSESTTNLLLEKGFYVLCRRFSSKEEKRRLIAALLDPQKIKYDRIGFENHLNYFYQGINGLEEQIAKGLTLFLNSTIVDLYFRIFSGHTQVNAADLRMLRYPSMEQLENLSNYLNGSLPSQEHIDSIIEKEVFFMEKDSDPVAIDKKIKEAISILKQLGLPKTQQNERSALTLLALLGLKPKTPWAKASALLIGITEMMNFFRDYYGKEYAPNTRETVRRFTVHQFVQAGIVIPNPDEPRPINSPHYVYQIEPSTLKLIREFGKKSWEKNLKLFLSSIETLQEQYKQTRNYEEYRSKFHKRRRPICLPVVKMF